MGIGFLAVRQIITGDSSSPLNKTSPIGFNACIKNKRVQQALINFL
jgi:hypothetical protein